tara:strand:- start:2330 stop:2650 length:321 start_codon:yes stop_codon:yes gene_type:complete
MYKLNKMIGIHNMAMVNTVVDQIGRMNAEELNRAVDAIKLRRTYLARQASSSFMVGDIVSFTGRRNATVTGRVTKINQKTVVVLDNNSRTQWKVTSSMLTPLSIGA